LRRLTAAALLVAACASPGIPPGGPPDVAAPEIVAISPDSGRTNVTPREVVFRFNEVVSERSPAATDLADLFIISPKDGTPRVSWNRDEIAVRPRREWRKNTAYTVTMMRGLADIRGNVRNAGASTFFSTGPTLPRTRITGQIFDWVSGAPAAGSIVESFVPPDSTSAYVAIADSSGRFVLEHLPAGRYLVRGVVDRNKNRGIDPGEPWDSTSVTLADSSVVELLVFNRDTVGPRLRDIANVDSLSLRVTFDKPIDPTQQLAPGNFSIVGRDSIPVPVERVTAPESDTVAVVTPPAGARPAAPSRDTAARPRPVMSRPRPISAVVLRIARPLTPGSSYRVRAIGLRGLLGHAADSERSYSVPSTPRAPSDSTARPVAPAPQSSRPRR
jgi:hypothetical protein